ncbi:helix-turn-helix domain-containing protein [Novosphingobium taihuense]|uniref:AraC-like DNA-binding protein n=1 Tax=Novosphingobium taihuense TaxID=260085 RepID=A0A7W7A7R6_9SPHN|nr:AraC family transcriptional regulator [Novosphingobium taihuense]MBB4611921.1 AraC-like DNA-binding protein [Novosphingobium taihuense]TWH88725.1 AraC-like DNA-binding protein [Novosphingobium taihuense]
MAVTPAQLASIFAANPVRGLRGGDGWKVDSTTRDIAGFHTLRTNAFAFSLEGATSFDSPGFCALVIVVEAGELTISQAGHVRTLSTGDIFVACAWQPMTLEGSDNLDLLIVTLPAWWAMQRFLDGFLILPDLYVAKDYFAASIIEQLVRSILALPSSEDTASSQGLTMLADLMRTALVACVDTGKALPRWQGRMGAILEFIIRNLDTPGLSAQDAATSLKCSVRTIYKTCAVYGTSFNAFLIEIRLVTAQYQLVRTHDRISHIAYGVGFASLSHFSHQFRARFGVSAKAMRQELGARARR